MPTTKYICNLCGQDFDSMEAAAADEKGHPMGKDFAVVAVKDYSGLWPQFVEVTNGVESSTYQLYAPAARKDDTWTDATGAPVVIAKPVPVEPSPVEPVLDIINP
jgi:hypothetical protein